jgi:hypothetical protein
MIPKLEHYIISNRALTGKNQKMRFCAVKGTTAGRGGLYLHSSDMQGAIVPGDLQMGIVRRTVFQPQGARRAFCPTPDTPDLVE